MNRDIIVVGASAGGLEVLFDMVRGLPADLPASIFIVLHTAPGHESVLPDLLSKRGPLPATHPLHEEEIHRGRIYVAPPDNHLLVRRGHMHVVRGPKENKHRPSADALFRTASSAYGSRVIGVVLSGYQDCGTAGLMSVRARGGLSVVQAPESAQAPQMAQNVLDRMSVDQVVTPEELPKVLVKLVATEAGSPSSLSREVAQLEGDEPGEYARLVCPACSGVLTEAAVNDYRHYRCHVGHTFSMQTLLEEQGEQMERALWTAVRVLEESCELNRRLANTEAANLRARFSEAAHTYGQQARTIRELLLRAGPGNPLNKAAV